MLHSLRIKNFKGWQDTGLIKMAPITLFFGANSSGKSSIGQFLMMLKQTAELPDRKAVFFLGDKRSAVQLGSYDEMVYHRDVKKNISFEYSWGLSKPMKVKNPLKQDISESSRLQFDAEVGAGEQNHTTLQVEKLEYSLLRDDDGPTFSIAMIRKPESRNEYKIEAHNYKLKRKMGRAWSLGVPVRFYGFPNEVVAYFQDADFVQQFNLHNENFFQSFSYLGPLRTKAERLYTWTGNEPESVGYSGEYTIAAILAAGERKISFGRRKQTKPLDIVIAEKLKEMALIDDFMVTPISDQRREYEVKIRTRGSVDLVNLPDVGFGVSQVLPVLTQSFYAPLNSILIMEQPEIHLHPAAQAALADVMIDVINSRVNGVDRNIQLIIETHSEHFLRRLQRRIAEEKLPRDKVTAYFANLTESPAMLDPLQIDEDGNIMNWPDNFFGDEMTDITEQAKAALKRRIHRSDQEKEDDSEE